jgi:MtaA/CmuA family methyltransferase
MAIKDSEALVDAMARVNEVLVDFVSAASRAGAEFVVVADPVASATMISPAMYRTLVLPAQQRLFAAAHMPVILHICGDTRPILSVMAESGAAALSLDQCMDLREARSLLGDTCGLAGNVDPMTLLTGTPDQVAEHTRKVVAAGGDRGFLVMPGCGIPPAAPLENVIAMVTAVRNG